jgi:hypothetical protein
MPFITYPAALPPPAGFPFMRRESRALPQGASDEQPRARSRDTIVDAAPVRWRYNAAQMAVWLDWFETTLLDGQLWFAATLPGRGGWITRAARYAGDVSKTHLGAGLWEVSARLELRGAGVTDLRTADNSVATTISGTAETAHLFELPSGAAGDLLVVCYSVDRQLATTVTLDTGASGENWTDTRLAADGARGYAGVAWKVAEGDDVLQLATSVGEQSLAVAYRFPGAASAFVASVNNGNTAAPNPPNNTPPGGLAEYLWVAFAVSTVLDADPANQSVFTGWPVGYVERRTLTGQPNNPSLATALRRTLAASENPGAFATSRTETALAFTIAVSY